MKYLSVLFIFVTASAFLVLGSPLEPRRHVHLTRRLNTTDFTPWWRNNTRFPNGPPWWRNENGFPINRLNSTDHSPLRNYLSSLNSTGVHSFQNWTQRWNSTGFPSHIYWKNRWNSTRNSSYSDWPLRWNTSGNTSWPQRWKPTWWYPSNRNWRQRRDVIRNWPQQWNPAGYSPSTNWTGPSWNSTGLPPFNYGLPRWGPPFGNPTWQPRFNSTGYNRPLPWSPPGYANRQPRWNSTGYSRFNNWAPRWRLYPTWQQR